MARKERQEQTLLDYGCGSGILAIAAIKLGASNVTGVDIDPQSIITSNENAERNHCSFSCHLPDEFPSFEPDRQYDIVVANILAGPLKTLTKTLTERIRKNGSLVLSGILEEQANDVIEAYAPYINLTVWKSHEGWVALSGQLNRL